jgi:hypothetical protein
MTIRPGRPGRGPLRKRLPAFLMLLVTTLACSGLSPSVPPTVPVAATAVESATRTPPAKPTSASSAATPATASEAAAYQGQFDCTGSEAGALAYSGRITIDPSGSVAFKDYDGNAQNGSWTYASPANTFTFTGNLALASATYSPTADTLAVVVSPDKTVVHAEGGRMDCERAVPGKTGPP